MAEAVPFGIAANILTHLGSSALQELGRIYGVNKELKRLQKTLATINAALLDAEERREQTHLVRDWMRKLKDVVYYADDVFDEMSTRAVQHRSGGRTKLQARELFSSLNSISFRYKLSHMIREIREKLSDVAADMSSFKFKEDFRTVENKERGQTHSFVLASELFGRDKNKEEVIAMLLSSCSEVNVSILPIVGIGGSGKTTLAQLLYNDERVVGFFERRIWVCVSEDFVVKSLVEKIIKSMTHTELGNLEMDELQIRLQENLNGKRYLLVLDDVWNESREKWDQLGNLLMGGARGSRIVVTTRGRKVSSVMGIESPYLLGGLLKEDSWALFEKIAFGGKERVHPSIVTIGRELVERCKGVPLAIKALGSAMQAKTKESEWIAVQENEKWTLARDDCDILPVLELSYNHLPVHLRQCFAYCSIFPKDCRISKEVLIQLWMAQGYIQASNQDEFLEDIGDEYVSDLLMRSFFQEAEEDEYGNVKSLKMHDLIHDLAQKIAGTDCSIVENKANDVSERVYHVSLLPCFSNSREVPRRWLKAKRMRTILRPLGGALTSESTQKKLISNFRSLRALDLHSSGMQKLPDSIGKLKFLKYLDLSHNFRMKRLPSAITNLYNLRTLKLSHCESLKELPADIRKLTNLIHLMIDGCRNLVQMPVGLGELTSLQRLPRFVMGRESCSDNVGGTLNELYGLNHLRGEICLENLENVKDSASESNKANLKEKKRLQSLRLEWGPTSTDAGGEEAEILLKNLEPHPGLNELWVLGYGGATFPVWLSSTTSLVKMTISECFRCTRLPSLNQLPFLKSLVLTDLARLEYAQDDLASSTLLPSLEELILEKLPNLKGWCNVGTMTVTADRLLFPRLSKLIVDDCPELVSIPLLPSLESLWLTNSNIQILMPMPTPTSTSTPSSSVHAPSTPFPKLAYLHLEGMEDLVFLPERAMQNLACLRELQLWNCPQLLSLSPVTRHLTALEKLDIWYCKDLDLLSNDTQWHGLSGLRSLVILDMQKLVCLPDGFRHFSNLKVLEIKGCSNFLNSPERVGQFRGLEKLEIIDCPNLTSLPDGMLKLASLNKLVVRGCLIGNVAQQNGSPLL